MSGIILQTILLPQFKMLSSVSNYQVLRSHIGMPFPGKIMPMLPSLQQECQCYMPFGMPLAYVI